MPLTKAQKKGNALEEALHYLETTFLYNNPATKDADITIETKKIVIVKGVKHEIDLFITIDNGRGFRSIFIFECKNWEKHIGKILIPDFSEKIKAVNAQRGYFIAKSFSRYARAQAAQDSRIELLTVNTELESLPPLITTYHIVHNQVLQGNVAVRIITLDPKKGRTRAFSDECSVTCQGKEYLLRGFKEHIQNIVISEIVDPLPTGMLSEGVYKYDRTKQLTYQRGELFVDGQEYFILDAHLIWETHIIRPKLIAKFDIQTRGRVFSVEFDKEKLPPGFELKTFFIDIDQ